MICHGMLDAVCTAAKASGERLRRNPWAARDVGLFCLEFRTWLAARSIGWFIIECANLGFARDVALHWWEGGQKEQDQGRSEGKEVRASVEEAYCEAYSWFLGVVGGASRRWVEVRRWSEMG